jgi:hypothetical protein
MKVANHVVLLANKRPQSELPAVQLQKEVEPSLLRCLSLPHESLSVTPPYSWVRPQKPFICYITQLPFSFCLPPPIIRKSNSISICDVIICEVPRPISNGSLKSRCHSSILPPPIRARYNRNDLYESLDGGSPHAKSLSIQDNTSLHPWDSNR